MLVTSEHTSHEINGKGNGSLNGIVDTTKRKPVTKQVEKVPQIETAVQSIGNRKRKLV